MGYSFVRFLPKETGVRCITNLRRRAYKIVVSRGPIVLISGAWRFSTVEIPEISRSLNQLNLKTYFQHPEHGEGIRWCTIVTNLESWPLAYRKRVIFVHWHVCQAPRISKNEAREKLDIVSVKSKITLTIAGHCTLHGLTFEAPSIRSIRINYWTLFSMLLKAKSMPYTDTANSTSTEARLWNDSMWELRLLVRSLPRSPING